VTARPSAQELFGPAGTPRVVVVGAGFGGIATGVKLRRAGIETFTIYESSLGIGGTWWDNTYPGAEVDVGSHLYCFSFKPHDWTRTHARQAELQKYLEETVDEFGLRPHLRLGVTVDSATWDETQHTWRVVLDEGGAADPGGDTTEPARPSRRLGVSVDECHVLISGVGFLNVPRYPDWPGLDAFTGPKFHTARWEHQHDLTGKVVAVVGTGSSATQIVPAIQPSVGTLYVFQREPGWVLPKGERDFTDDERASFGRVWRKRRERWRLKWLLEKNLRGGRIWRPGTKQQRAREEVCRRYISRQFKDRLDLAVAVTPRYPYPGKRPIFASTWYPALKQPNVELVPKAVASVTPGAIVDADGVERAVDVIVMATGFQPANYLARLPITGRDGRTLRLHWAGEPRAYLGITVPGFPNMFLLYGPGTNGGDIVSMLEAQADFAVRAIRRMVRGRVTAIEVRPSFEARWYRWLQSKMDGTSWTVSNNYFKSETGKVVTQWPYGNTFYVVLTKVLGRVSETTRRRLDGASRRAESTSR
jgi:cation diffusion facilitator CzcD-associated flavoprotein CzcO